MYTKKVCKFITARSAILHKHCLNSILNFILESHLILNQVQDALASYVPCEEKYCGCHTAIITKSLYPFGNGITKEMLDRVRKYGTKYQILNNRLYRDPSCLFPARCAGIEYFLKSNIQKLPNLEMIVNSRDWPQISIFHEHSFGPVFSFSTTSEYYDIMYPAWSFWEGGPAISLYPTGLGRWDQHRQSINDATYVWPWSAKKSMAFFRGSRTSAERDSLVLLSRKMPELVDAQYTKNQAWKSPKDTLHADPAKEVSLEDHCQYKYLFNFRGVAASFRFKHLFLCKSLVFHVGDEWQEFFYESLRPWVHYVPLPKEPSVEELQQLLEFFIEHDDIARAIAERGHKQIWDHLKMKDIHCYWRKLLRKYAKLLQFDVNLDLKLIEV